MGKETPEGYAANNSRRGIASASQGAVLSPTAWLAFFDILLVALPTPEVKKDNIILPGLPGKLIYTHNPANMDDLITPSETLESL